MLSFLNKKKGIEIKSPVKGIIKRIEDVRDPVFAQKMMGDGIAIQYVGGDVYAPVSGIISAIIQPSMHAFGIRSGDGVEILVHVGLDTVALKGGEFTLLKQQGEYVEAGEKVLQVNYEQLKEKGIDLITPVILTNGDAFYIDMYGNIGNEVEINRTTIFSVKKK